jgi:maltose alpha-D-glucosyltransferase/alpha-amylase
VLLTGDDISIIDFEGEPARPLGERRLTRPPFADAAAMIRSFANAAYTLARSRDADSEIAPNRVRLAWVCQRWVAAAWLNAYLVGMEGTGLLPTDSEARRLLLDALLLERGVYELGHALQHRPDRAEIALAGLIELLAEPADLAMQV